MRGSRIIVTISIASALLVPLGVTAQGTPSCPYGEFEVPLPVEQFEGKTICEIIDEFGGGDDDVVRPLRSYVAFLANLIIAAIIGLALIMTVVGGYLYMTAGGAADRIQTAKKVIGGALLGIIIALLTFVIFNTINPAIIGQTQEPDVNVGTEDAAGVDPFMVDF